MNILHQPQTTVVPDAPQRFLLRGVNWQAYEKMLDAIGDRPIRVTYDRGSLELMSPSPRHEYYNHLLCLFFGVLAEELQMPLRGCPSTTFRRQDLGRGLEPDECYYLANALSVRDFEAIDLSVDPPPDLAIEVEITSSCLDRIDIYANLGVPELWRFDGEALQPYRLRPDRAYETCDASPALPFVPLAELVPLLQQGLGTRQEGEWLLSVRAWVRERVLPAFRAGPGAQQPPEGNG
jgi:Uma2 family endonuclease